MEQFWNEWGSIIIWTLAYFAIMALFMAFGRFLKNCDKDMDEMTRKR